MVVPEIPSGISEQPSARMNRERPGVPFLRLQPANKIVLDKLRIEKSDTCSYVLDIHLFSVV